MTALLGMLAVAGYQNRDKIAEMLQGLGGHSAGAGSPQPGQVPNAGRTPQSQGGLAQGGLGGLLGGLGGLLGGAGAGAGAGNVINGGLGELLDQFRKNGKGDVAESWVGTGPNREISPDGLKQAIDPAVLDTLSEQTGLSHDELLRRLSSTLPTAVDRYTPDGRLPS